MKTIHGSVKVKVAIGMKARINPDEIEGKIHAGKEFIIAGEPVDICGTECVALNNLDGTRFSANYDLSMLQITDLDRAKVTVVSSTVGEIERKVVTGIAAGYATATEDGGLTKDYETVHEVLVKGSARSSGLYDDAYYFVDIEKADAFVASLTPAPAVTE